MIEHYTDVPVLGAMHEDERLALVERHLGLMPANEAAAAESRIAAIAERVAAQVDLDALLKVNRGDTPLPLSPPPVAQPTASPVRLAIARDAAFGFYYADDLDALAAAGAILIPFDTLRDAHLPACDALFIGGGFPETFADALEANASLRSDIRTAIEAGLPAYAECGGLMFLARALSWRGKRREMVGVIPGEVTMHDRPVGRGYVALTPTTGHPWRAAIGEAPPLRAHEFHYSSLDGLPAGMRYAYEVKRGHGIDGRHDGIVYKNLLASYTHLRSTGDCDWANRFVGFARRCKIAGCFKEKA